MRDASTGREESARYEIRVQGHLDSRWAIQFDGMTFTTRADGTTALEGPVVDQAVLHGLLAKLRDIGIPLVSVTRSVAGSQTAASRPRPPSTHPAPTPSTGD